jgi:hypothetical protein
VAVLNSETVHDKVNLAAVGGKSLLVIGKKARRITILRYLVSKIVFKEQIAVRDILAIFQCILDCQDLARRDPNFQQKFGLALEALAKSLKSVRITRLSIETLNSLRRAILNVPEEFFYPKRNLSQLKKKVEGQFHLHFPKQLGVPTKSLPPKLYIGQGYRDKGSARNLAFDGSPRWQDVAVRRRIP